MPDWPRWRFRAATMAPATRAGTVGCDTAGRDRDTAIGPDLEPPRIGMAKPQPWRSASCQVTHGCASCERVPIKWNHLIDELSKSNRWSRAEAKNFFNDVLCVPVNPTHQVLPSLPASVPADMVKSRFGRFGNPPIASVYFGTRSKSLVLRDDRSVHRARRFEPSSVCGLEVRPAGERSRLAREVYVCHPKKPARHAR
jgi:hypothetical protein